MTRMLHLAMSALALSLAAAAFAPAASAKTFTAKDMASLDRIDDPRVSPDGHYALYALRTVDYAANKASKSLWIADLKTHASRRLAISDGGASSGRWSPDGSIYFLSDRAGGIDQVFRTDLSGKTAVQVTSGPLAVGAFKIAPGGKVLVVSLSVFPDCPDVACTKARLDAAKANKATGMVFDRLFVRHWDAWADGTRNHLYVLTLDANGTASSPPIALMNGFDGDVPSKPFGDDGDFAITPDNKFVAFSAKSGRDEAWTTNYDVWLAPLDGSGPPQNLTAANKAWDAGPVFSADGKWAAWRAMKRPGFEADRFAIMLRDAVSGAEREVAPDWDRSPENLAWSPDGKTLYATADDVGETRLFAIDVATGKVTPLTKTGRVAAFDVGPSGIVFARDSLTGPAQLFSIVPGGRAVQLTHTDAEALKGVRWGKTEQFSFKGWNDEMVHGYVLKPANFNPGRKYPVAFLIHGGPQGSFGNAWSYRWNPQIYANAGYAVVTIDFHGSTGYGQAFTDSISRHWGDRPLEDLQKGWAFALAKFRFLDGDRACALGGSYGGYMIDWIAGVWNQPWKCLVDHDGTFDNRGMGYATEELWFDEWENGGTFYDTPEAREEFNPVNHVKAWSKPMLVIHGARDYRIPLAQALGTFAALQRRGIESKFLYFPDENHWVLKPQDSAQWYAVVLGWLDRWTKKGN
jgi:dipeptidyl aminopeptidase/acylaminoacyl peptidase